MTPDEVIHVPDEDEAAENTAAENTAADNAETDRVPGMGETEILPGGGITEGDAVPEMPPGSGMTDEIRNDYRGGGLDATDIAQPTSTVDTTGDRATGLTSLHGE